MSPVVAYTAHTNHTCLYSPAAKASPRPLAGTHCVYPRRDGQAELTWVTDTEINVTLPSSYPGPYPGFLIGGHGGATWRAVKRNSLPKILITFFLVITASYVITNGPSNGTSKTL